MKTALKEMIAAATVADIPFQPASLDIWSTKYRLMAKDGTVIDQDEISGAIVSISWTVSFP